MKFSTEKAKILVARQGLTIERLSKIADMPLITITQVLGGKRKPTLRTIGRLAQGLGVDVTEIIEPEAN